MSPSPRRPYRAPASKPPSRLRIALPTIVIGVLFLGLAGFWSFVSWRTGAEVDFVDRAGGPARARMVMP